MSKHPTRNQPSPDNDPSDPVVAADTPGAPERKPYAPITRTVLCVCVFLVLAAAFVFGQSVKFQFINFDDDQYVYRVPIVYKGLTLKGVRWAITGIHAHNRHPLTTLSHMLDCQIYKLQPWGHHLGNVVLHGATCVLLFLVLYRMMGNLWPSALTAAVFAVHPLRAESVAWISERKDVLSGLFFMLTLAAYLYYVRRPFSLRRYLLVVVCLFLGLMSKPMLVTLPFLLLVLDYWPLGRLDTLSAFGRRLLEKVPLIAMAVMSSVMTLTSQRVALEALENVNFGARIANAIVAYAQYLGMFFYPVNLIPFYPHPINKVSYGAAAAAELLLAAIFVLAFVARKKHPYLLVGWLWYVGMLVPVIGLVQVGEQSMADRYTYLTQIGIVIALAWGLAWGFQRLGTVWPATWPDRRWLAGVAAAVVLVSLTAAARIQVGYWRDNATLWQHTLRVDPHNYIAHLNYGNVLFESDRIPEAAEQYRIAIQCNPKSEAAHYNLGEVLHRMNQNEEAFAELQKALDIEPTLVQAYYDMGNILIEKGKFKEAAELYQKAITINPDYLVPLNNLGNALLNLGRDAEAIQYFRRAIDAQPDNVDACFNLANVLAEKGQLDEAIALWHNAIQHRPAFAQAYLHLGIVFRHKGDLDQAIIHFQKALEINPNLAQAREHLTALGQPLPAGPFPRSITETQGSQHN